MKLDDIDIEPETQSIPDGFEISMDELLDVDFQTKTFERDDGTKTKRWLFEYKKKNYYVGKQILRIFKRAISEGCRSVKISKTGEGMRTHYEGIFKG
ncbi:MAG: hypothetical protein JW778_04010 [Candidatus Altiarchaeota archaeon]|nr:hypothetical protein [Candidatus Altiarchaeota archaeon]